MSEKLQTILREIDHGTRKYIFDVDLTVEDLLTKDESGVYFLEHLLKNKISLYGMMDKIENNIEVGYMFCLYDESLYGFKFDENSLFSTIDGKTFVEHILEHNKLTSDMVSIVKEHIEIIDLIISYKKEHLLNYLAPEIIERLMLKNDSGSYDIEKYLSNKDAVRSIIPLVNDVDKLTKLCEKYNDYELMRYVNENVLMTKLENDDFVLNYLLNEKKVVPAKLESIPSNIDFIKFLIENKYYDYLKMAYENEQLLEVESGKTLLELLVEKGYIPEIHSIYEEQTIKILNKIKKLDIIDDVSDELLLKKASELLNDNVGDETFLEYMLDSGYNPISKRYYIGDEKVFEILYKKQRYDLLIKSSQNLLFKFANDSKTYFEHIIKNIKSGKFKARISDMYPYGENLNLIVNYYLTVAKEDMIEYISEIKEEELLKKYGDITLLEALLEKNSSLTLNKIIGRKLKSNPKIATILKSMGFEQKNVDVSFENNDFISDYLEEVQNHLGIGPFQNEGEFLLNKLEQLFLNDDKSDKELISALVSGYRQSLLINYKVNIEELKKLIEIKEQNLDKFFYIKEDEGAYFSPRMGSVFCESAVVETLLHETGHALHFYLNDNKIPENYVDIIEHARNNSDILKNTEEYADKYSKLRESIIAIVEQKYQNFFETYYNEEKKEEIRNILINSKKEKKEEYISLGIPEEQLDLILEEIFTEEEYIAHQKRIFIYENVDSILRSEFGSFIAIGDILDAIYEGFLNSSNLKNQNGEKVKRTYGHGINYYYSTSHGFDEMIANFAFISKSKDAVEILQLLKETVGEEVYNMINDFYYQNIVGIKEEQLETGKTIGGK